MYNKYFALGITALLAAGAGCASTSTTNTSNATNLNLTNTNPTLEVPVDANSNINEAVVEEDTTEIDEDVDDTIETTDETDEATDTEDADNEVDDEEETTEATVQEFDVVASQFEFTPGTITVKKGDTVKLNLSSEDVPHGFSLAVFDISETLSPGKTTTVEFVADQAGTFNFICNIVCGSGHSGMTGQLIVEE